MPSPQNNKQNLPSIFVWIALALVTPVYAFLASESGQTWIKKVTSPSPEKDRVFSVISVILGVLIAVWLNKKLEKNQKLNNAVDDTFTSVLSSKNAKGDFIKSSFLRSIIRSFNSTPDCYYLRIIYEVSDPQRMLIFNDGLWKNSSISEIKFDVIDSYFMDGDFSTFITTATYTLDTIWHAFRTATRDGKSHLGLIEELTILPEQDPRLEQINKIKILHENHKNLEKEIEYVDRQINNLESLVKSMKNSDLLQDELRRNHNKLDAFRKLRHQALSIKDNYTELIKQYVLLFYIEDVSSSSSRSSKKNIDWEGSYEPIKNDHAQLKSAIEAAKN